MRRLSLSSGVRQVQSIKQSINRHIHHVSNRHVSSLAIVNDAIKQSINHHTKPSDVTRHYSSQAAAAVKPTAAAQSINPQAVKAIADPSAYFQAHNRSLTDPEGFWGDAAKQIHWRSDSGPVFRQGDQPHDYRWFPDHELNMSENCLDYHVANGRGDQLALIMESPITGTCQKLTYSQLLAEVEALAAAYKRAGLKKGDRVMLYMSQVKEGMIAMQACARLGLVHIVVFGGFAAPELAKRMVDAQPKLIITTSCGVEPSKILQYKPILDEAIALSGIDIETVVMLQRPQHHANLSEKNQFLEQSNPSAKQPTYVDFNDFVRPGDRCAPVPVKSADPLYIIHTSGTTAQPKGVQRDTGGYAVALKWVIQEVVDLRPGDVMLCTSDIGWALAHSYCIYAPLLAGATIVMFEGKPVGTPDAGTYWRIVKEHNVKILYTAPTAIRALKQSDPTGQFAKKYGIGTPQSSLKYLFLAGERADPDTVKYVHSTLNVPAVDQFWQTETGYTTVGTKCLDGQPIFPIKAGSAGYPVCGYNIRVLDDEGQLVIEPGMTGNLAIKLPLPPGCFYTLWNSHQRWVTSYMERFPGWYDLSDGGYIDEDGYVFIMGRSDDVMNVAGHRLSSGQMEASIAAHPAVAETAVVAAKDPLKGHVPVGFVVLKSGMTIDEQQLEKDLIAKVRHDVGALACYRTTFLVKRLPKTRSGKVLRNVLRDLIDRVNPRVPATIEDIGAVEEITNNIQHRLGPVTNGQPI